MTGFVTLTSKNQITLPVGVVRLLEWPIGTELWVREIEDKVILEKIPAIMEIRRSALKNSKVRRLNAKYSSTEIVHLARNLKPPKSIYEP